MESPANAQCIAVSRDWRLVFFVFTRNTFTNTFLALLVAFLGVLLSLFIRELTSCDAGRRDYLRKKVQTLDRIYGMEIFPDEESEEKKKSKIEIFEMWIMRKIFFDRLRSEEEGRKRIRGLWVMQRILGLFCVIDLVLTVIAAAR